MSGAAVTMLIFSHYNIGHCWLSVPLFTVLKYYTCHRYN